MHSLVVIENKDVHSQHQNRSLKQIRCSRILKLVSVNAAGQLAWGTDTLTWKQQTEN